MHYTLFGESHGPAVGVLLTDVPPGLPVDEVFIREQLLRRMGQGGLTTARQEKEEVRFLSGAYQGRICRHGTCHLCIEQQPEREKTNRTFHQW